MTTFPVPDHIILFGGSPLIVAVAKMLRMRNLHVDIYTSPRHEAEPIGEQGETLGTVLTRAGLDFYQCTDDIERDFPIDTVGPWTMGLGFGEAWPFSQRIIDAFGGRLLDFMGIPLPKFRGGAHYSWAIMQQALCWGCCLQRVTATTVQGERDDGEVICKDSFTIGYTAITPQDWFNECNKREVQFLSHFLDVVLAGMPFASVLIREEESVFFPRLKTTENGWINWNWAGNEICDFINAFDRPYSGASTTIEGQVVQLRGASLVDASFHPFASGLIINLHDGLVTVATTDGALQIDVAEMNGAIINNELKLGDRFFTSQERLERALTYKPTYTAQGHASPRVIQVGNAFKGKKVTLRLLLPSDCTQTYVNWLNDSAVNKYLESRWTVATLDSVRRYVTAMLESATNYAFAIVENATGRHVGNIKIGDINAHHKYADIGYLIGAKDTWGRGYATEAIGLATGIAFNALGIHHLRAGVYESNVGSCKALRKAGYNFDGIWHGQLQGEKGREGHAWYSRTSDVMQPQ